MLNQRMTLTDAVDRNLSIITDGLANRVLHSRDIDRVLLAFEIALENDLHRRKAVARLEVIERRRIKLTVDDVSRGSNRPHRFDPETRELEV